MLYLRLSLALFVNVYYYDSRPIAHIRNTVIKLPFMVDWCAAVVGCHFVLYKKERIKMFDVKVERVIVAVAVAEINKQGMTNRSNEDQGYIIADCLKACYNMQHFSGASVHRLVAEVVDDYI